MKIRLTKKDTVQELKEIVDHMELLLDQIINKKQQSLDKPLSVELRKIFSKGQGNDLLTRIEKELNIKLIFPGKGKKLPPKTIKISLDEYRAGFIFSLGGRPFSRIKLIKITANQLGAHTDEKVDQIYFQSKNIKLPLGNLARGGILLDQNTYYLTSIAITTVKVVKEQVLKLAK